MITQVFRGNSAAIDSNTFRVTLTDCGPTTRIKFFGESDVLLSVTVDGFPDTEAATAQSLGVFTASGGTWVTVGDALPVMNINVTTASGTINTLWVISDSAVKIEKIT